MEYKVFTSGVGELEEQLNQHAGENWTLDRIVLHSASGGVFVVIMTRQPPG
jgi:hypothetical protein